MIEAVKFNLANLLNFEGRDSRSTFWFYILFLFIVYFVVSMILTFAWGGGLFVGMMQDAKLNGAPDEADLQNKMMLGMAQLMRGSVWLSIVTAAVGSFLLSASFTRRLHDSGRPGWIAVLLIVIYLASVALTIGMAHEVADAFEHFDIKHPEAMQQAMAGTQREYALRGLVGWIPMIALVVFGVWPSSDGDNRYGAEPEHF